MRQLCKAWEARAAYQGTATGDCLHIAQQPLGGLAGQQRGGNLPRCHTIEEVRVSWHGREHRSRKRIWPINQVPLCPTT